MEYELEVQYMNIRNLCRSGSLVTVWKELLKYKLYFVSMQEVRLDGSGAELVGE
jgi:hypothetical protein